MHSPRSSARREQSSSATPPQQREPLPAPIPSSSSLKLVQPGLRLTSSSSSFKLVQPVVFMGTPSTSYIVILCYPFHFFILVLLTSYLSSNFCSLYYLLTYSFI